MIAVRGGDRWGLGCETRSKRSVPLRLLCRGLCVSLNTGTETKEMIPFPFKVKVSGKILWRKNCLFPFYSITVGQEIDFADFCLLSRQLEK